jgi:hypothetical protein
VRTNPAPKPLEAITFPGAIFAIFTASSADNCWVDAPCA